MSTTTLKSLVEKLQGKPVHKTLKRLSESNATNLESLKGLFSLGTHTIIEMEKGGKEYAIILPLIHEKIGQFLAEK